MGLTNTPQANRLHIALFGKRNSGKSSLLNAITKQEVSMVSPIAGTTTDPVYKAMELHGIGPVVFLDTAGFDDEGYLGELRVEKTKDIITKTDIALLLIQDHDLTMEKEWITLLKEKQIPILPIYNVKEGSEPDTELIAAIHNLVKEEPYIINALHEVDTDGIREQLIRLLPQNYQEVSIVGHLVKENDVVLLVMPQDIQAPKGRLILPQVQTIRDLLDHNCIVQSCTADKLEQALPALSKPPQLIITDSQVFDMVYEKKPKESLLTSFSVLFAKYKGDIAYFIESASHIAKLTEKSKVLIAEACTHAPLSEDIGRVKIPAMLKRKVGQGIRIDMVSGTDFPKDLSGYDLIIHCAACMFNRKYVLSRVEQAKEAHVPMTNYGIIIAFLKKILPYVVY